VKTSDLIRKAGGQQNVARLFRITRQAVSQWGEYVPLLRQLQLQKMKPRWFRDGRLKVSQQQDGGARRDDRDDA
jgi:hypothetical protein